MPDTGLHSAAECKTRGSGKGEIKGKNEGSCEEWMNPMLPMDVRSKILD